jgi:hypothetical protein
MDNEETLLRSRMLRGVNRRLMQQSALLVAGSSAAILESARLMERSVELWLGRVPANVI